MKISKAGFSDAGLVLRGTSGTGVRSRGAGTGVIVRGLGWGGGGGRTCVPPDGCLVFKLSSSLLSLSISSLATCSA